ncbi:MAG: branched-chain amino acid ABC transporter permease [Nitrososphaerota archaeon]|nr:branched-chain amino acid ABC transporter permease [Candidatus Calditenuaceae archaeon]MDW8073737.1 branched-chain amino acid ABC transporter permease [Nitrososphaerota archaeon]
MTSLENLGLALLDGLVTGSVMALVALGLTIVFGIMNIANLTHGELYMLGAMTSWLLFQAALPFASALLLAPLLTAAVAVAINVLILQRFGHEPGQTILATFGLLLILQQTALGILGPAPRSVPAPLNPILEFSGFSYSGFNLLAGLACLLLALLVWVLVERSRLGLLLRAAQENRLMAESLAIDTGRVILIGFALSGGLAGLAGALTSPIRQIHFLMGLDALVVSFVVVVLGGVGRIGGTIAAGLALGLLESLTALLLAPTLARVLTLALALSYIIARRLGVARGVWRY